MTYLLTDRLPDTVSVNGIPFKVETDFRLFVRFERDVFLNQFHFRKTLTQFYQGKIPSDIQAAFDAFLKFYRFDDDAENRKGKETSQETVKIPYSFSVDDGRIYAAFLREYRIYLGTTEMHWFEFKALLNELIGAKFGDVVRYRVLDFSGMEKHEKKHYARLQAEYRIERPGEKDLAKRDDDWVSWARKIKERAEKGGS